MPYLSVMLRLPIWVCLCVWLSACGAVVPIDRTSLTTPGQFPKRHAPIDLCAAAVTDQLPRVMSDMPKPKYLQPIVDPAFGARVIRVTNSASGFVQKPLYNTIQAWNADESLMLLYRRGFRSTDYVLLDGHTYKPVSRLDISPADFEEVFWSRHNPDLLFYVSSSSQRESQFFAYNVRTRERGLIKDFAPYCQRGSVARGGTDVHMQSLDDDLFGFRCKAPEGGFHLMSYRISSDELNVVKAGDGNDWGDWRAPMAGPSGQQMWLQGDVVDPTLQTIKHRLDMANAGEHGDIGLDHTGQDAIFQTVFDPSPQGCDGSPDRGVGHLGAHSFVNGDCRSMITESEGWPYTTSGTHVSAGAYKQPGWVTLSSVGYREQLPFHQNGKPATPLFSEIYLVNTNPSSSQVCRLAHHRSYGKFAKNGGYPAYFGEPHPSQSPSGTRIVFGSDWQDSGTVDAYVIELPGYKRPEQ